MKSPKPPNQLFHELSPMEQRFVLTLLRAHMKDNKLYQEYHKQGVGLERAEEVAIGLLDKGIIKMFHDVKQDRVYIKVWDGTKYI